jgi:hypothetical protein
VAMDPIGVFRFAETFFKAGHHLRTAREAETLILPYDDPIYYDYSHALELAMKAFLLAKGVSAERLHKKFGHKLQLLWDECLRAGLVRDNFIGEIIEYLDPFAQSLEFRYLKTGRKTLPVLSEVEEAVDRLMAAVQKHIPGARPWRSLNRRTTP